MPAAWSPTGYAAVFIEESPEVRFNDLLTVTVSDRSTYLPIDPRFLDACEPDSVQVYSCVPDEPVLVGAAVECGGVRVNLGPRADANPKCFTCKIKAQYRRTRRELFPVLSRIQNIGYDLGENGRTPESYRANHRTPWVAGQGGKWRLFVRDAVRGLMGRHPGWRPTPISRRGRTREPLAPSQSPAWLHRPISPAPRGSCKSDFGAYPFPGDQQPHDGGHPRRRQG